MSAGRESTDAIQASMARRTCVSHAAAGSTAAVICRTWVALVSVSSATKQSSLLAKC